MRDDSELEWFLVLIDALNVVVAEEVCKPPVLLLESTLCDDYFVEMRDRLLAGEELLHLRLPALWTE